MKLIYVKIWNYIIGKKNGLIECGEWERELEKV